MEASATTRLCAVIGDPVEHSLSPQIQNAAFRHCGLDFAYVAFHVRRGKLNEALSGVRALNINGLSVTIPHKVDILPLLDEVSPDASYVGSVNTVVNRQGWLVGHSTDGPGALRALQAEGIEPAGKSILILGSGGAARAIAFALALLSPPPQIELLGIVEEELKKLAHDLSLKTAAQITCNLLNDRQIASGVAACEIIIHATPVGMAPEVDHCLVSGELLQPGHAVFDAVYTPFETELLKRARRAGARIVPGLGMFVHQAAIQFELWTGAEAPVEVMREAVKKALSRPAE